MNINTPEFFFGDGIKSDLIQMPYQLIENDDEEGVIDKAFCICGEELSRTRARDFDFESHNLTQCMLFIRDKINALQSKPFSYN
jgi:hypothetical protein